MPRPGRNDRTDADAVRVNVVTDDGAVQAGLSAELDYWRRYLDSGGLDHPEQFEFRFTADTELQREVADALPASREPADLRLLDVGAGPATMLGKRLRGVRLDITATDVLADEFGALLRDRGLVAPVRTVRCEAERVAMFGPRSFDLVYMRYVLDHVRDPRRALEAAWHVLRPDGSILIDHFIRQDPAAHHGWRLTPVAADLLVESYDAAFHLSEVLPQAALATVAGDTWFRVRARFQPPGRM